MTSATTSVQAEHRRLREWIETADTATRRREATSEVFGSDYFDGMRAAYTEVIGYLDGRYDDIKDAPTERPVADDLTLAVRILSAFLEAATRRRFLLPTSHASIMARDLVLRHQPELATPDPWERP